jgi:hypothetical protein
MAGTMNLTKFFKPQGVGKFTSHEAVVVDNKDKDRLGRIKVRIKELHQGIEDEHLPWCIPKFGHADGAKGKDAFDRSGTFYVPKKGTKVLVEFQDGNPHYPVWKGYTVDDTTRLKEMNKNYPDRACLRFSTGAFIIIDTKTNEVMIHNPGDMHLIIQGDIEQSVHGNMQETTHSSKDKAIDSYLRSDKELPVGEAKQHQEKKVNFKGLGKTTKSGNRHIHVGGDYTLYVEGDRITHVDGDDTTIVKGNKITKVQGYFDTTVQGYWKVTGSSTGEIKMSSTLTVNASMIFLN